MVEVSIYSLGKEESHVLNVLNLNIVLSEILFNIDISCLIQLSSINEILTNLPPVIISFFIFFFFYIFFFFFFFFFYFFFFFFFFFLYFFFFYFYFLLIIFI